MAQLKKNLHLKRRFKTRPGVSLIIGLVLVTVIAFFAIITSINIIDSIRQSSAVNNASVAYFASEGAVEKGLLVNLSEDVGYNSGTKSTVLFGGDPDCLAQPITNCQSCCYCNYGSNSLGCSGKPYSPDNFNQCYTACTNKPSTNVKSTFTIQGTVPANKLYSGGYYGIPAPGTGSAGTACDPLQIPYLANNPIAGNFWYSKSLKTYKYQDSTPGGDYTGPFTIIDHPCNWGKIGEGETVSIPLYYTDGTGAHNIIGPTSTFSLKVRTPCNDGSEMCAAGSRYALAYGQMNTNYYYNDPIMSWQVVGTDRDDEGKQYNLNAILKTNPLNNKILNISTIITESSIANALSSGFEVLNNTKFGEDLNGCKGSISNFLNNLSTSFSVWSSTDQCNTILNPSYLWTSQKMDKPILKLSVIGSLFDNANPSNKVPYLEYQILMSGTTNPPTNSVQTITGESVSGSFKQILEVKVPQESGILEYVIQQ